jgi:integrase
MKAMRPTVKKPTPAIELEDVTPHDLRRTAASGMTALGINRLVVAKILNHVESGVTAVYDRHGYDAEKRHALDAWTSHLESILSGKPKAENVVSLAAGDVAL